MPHDYNDEISVQIGDCYVVVWPRHVNSVATIDLDIRANPGTTIEINMTDHEAEKLHTALGAAIPAARAKAGKWKAR